MHFTPVGCLSPADSKRVALKNGTPVGEFTLVSNLYPIMCNLSFLGLWGFHVARKLVIPFFPFIYQILPP